MTGIHLTVSAILSCWAVVVYGGETCGEGPCKIPHIVHVTSIPPTAIMNGSRMLDTALSVLGMVRARRACLEAGVGIVSLMVLVEEGDLANPALEQVRLCAGISSNLPAVDIIYIYPFPSRLSIWE